MRVQIFIIKRDFDAAQKGVKNNIENMMTALQIICSQYMDHVQKLWKKLVPKFKLDLPEKELSDFIRDHAQDEPETSHLSSQ